MHQLVGQDLNQPPNPPDNSFYPRHKSFGICHRYLILWRLVTKRRLFGVEIQVSCAIQGHCKGCYSPSIDQMIMPCSCYEGVQFPDMRSRHRISKVCVKCPTDTLERMIPLKTDNFLKGNAASNMTVAAIQISHRNIKIRFIFSHK